MIWFIWFVSFVWLNQTDQINQINKTNQFEHPASLDCRARRSYADDFLILLNVERKKRRIPCQDRDLVDFKQVIR